MEIVGCGLPPSTHQAVETTSHSHATGSNMIIEVEDEAGTK
jgi:hypothetical protein